MYNFITIRCKCCGSVICNLPEDEIRKIKFLNPTCEDCNDHDNLQIQLVG